MSTLEQQITESAKKGELTALTIWPCSGGFQCNVRRRSESGQDGWSCVVSSDPVEGLRRAFGAPPKAAPVVADPDLLI